MSGWRGGLLVAKCLHCSRVRQLRALDLHSDVDPHMAEQPCIGCEEPDWSDTKESNDA